MPTLSIGELARRAGVEPSTIRYYEQIGLLPCPKRLSGRRVYQEDMLKRLTLIKAVKAAGFTIAEMQMLMSSWETEGRSPREWRGFVERKLAETEAVILQAQRTKEILQTALSCGCWDDFDMPLDDFVASKITEQDAARVAEGKGLGSSSDNTKGNE